MFPLNEGWLLPGSQHTKLTEIFNIHNMTQYLTQQLIGEARPNSEKNWAKRVSLKMCRARVRRI